MPPRNPELPEGTDQIVNGTTAEEGGGKNVGFVASGGNGPARAATDKLVSQVRDQVETLRGQAGDKLRTYAGDGKGRATGLLDDFAGVIDDAAKSIDERLGAEYGDYAHRASEAVASFAGRVRDKTVDDLVDDTRDIVRKSPAIAIAAAAVVGFALIRLVRTGLDDLGATRTKSGGRKRPARNSDTNTSGGA